MIRDLRNEKRDHPHLRRSSSSEVEGVRIVVISFRNIAKKIYIRKPLRALGKKINPSHPRTLKYELIDLSAAGHLQLPVQMVGTVSRLKMFAT